MNELFHPGRTRLLSSEVRWLMQLRWAAGVVMILLGGAHWAWFRTFDITYEPLALGGAILVINAVLVWAHRRCPTLSTSASQLITFASVQMHMDLACLTVLALWTGGAQSPILPAYFFHMLFAALLQPRVRAYAVALVAILGLMLALWLSGHLPSTRAEALRLSIWAVMLLVTIYLANRVAHALYQRERARERQVERAKHLLTTLRAQQETLVHNEKMAAMGQAAAGIAHEINNPLASMDSVLQLMQRRPDAPRPDAVATLREQVQRILRTVRQLTTYAHPGEGRVQVLPVNDVVRSALDMFALSKDLSRVTIDRALDDAAGSAPLNPQALQQVLINLLVNALDATKGQGAPRVSVRTRRDDTHAIIEVSDNGVGIAPDIQARIFEPFFTTKPVGHGTGLGLSICARLLREQHGTLAVHSSLGQGATFTVKLPLTQSPQAAGQPVQATRAEHAR